MRCARGSTMRSGCRERSAYALALDRDKSPVDSLCSNIGHLLWSGIVPPERTQSIADRLMSPELFSGWGIRTMSSTDAAYSPLSYHNGTVWPHDSSLCAWGLAKSGDWSSAHRIAHALIDAAPFFDHQLPEVFAGLERDEAPFPVAYPTAAKPQAWAAGAPVLLLRVLLGLEIDRSTRRLVSTAPGGLSHCSVALHGVPALGTSWDVTLEDGVVQIEEAA